MSSWIKTLRAVNGVSSMFPDPVAFVDLETTGMTARGDRVTEVGIVRVEDGRITEWSSLVNPECSIPPAIQALTGITNAMVADAPRFVHIAREVAARIAGCVFVAHNARFDYGFLKHEFGRLGQAFTVKVLCTVKLSRRLFADAAQHNLDSLIERHHLPSPDRHRALGDARILWAFVQALYRNLPAAEVDAAVARILRAPSLPPHLPIGALDAIPESPGTYRFYGLNPMPLYVGKSVNLRDRVAAHFSSDYRSANDMRLSSEVVRIEFEETAGELGALLRESQLVKSLFPTHNQRLRRRTDLIALSVALEPSPPDYLRADVIEPRDLHGLYGPFSSRRAARETLRDIAAEAALCLRLLGLERRNGPCFARQIKKCAGACVGAETLDAHHHRFRQALAPYALRQWPYGGIVSTQETSLTGERTDVHLFRDWCWLGTAGDEGSLQALLEAPPRAAFDLDIYRILCKRLPRLRVHAFPQERAPAHQVHCIP
jgi:DNA polymerase-3 subunit epsilon